MTTGRQRSGKAAILATGLLLALAVASGPGAAAEPMAILCGRLIDGRGDAATRDRVVLVEGERITAVGGPEIVPEGARIIDLSHATVLPGLIDAHVHPLIRTDDYQTYHLKKSSAYKALHGLKTVQDLLRSGWTTLRIAGDADVYYAHLEIRNAIEEGLFLGPRITGAGHYLSVTGGGGDINYLAPEQAVLADGLVVDGVDEVRKAVRQEIKQGSDWIKLLVSGAFMSSGDNPRQVHFSPDELRAAMEEAATRGVPVMAHAHSAESIKQAVRAGARSVEHGTFLDDEAIRLLKEHGTYLVPTIYIGRYYLDEHADSEAQTKMVELTRRYRAQRLEGVRKAIQAGVRIAVGSDFVGFPPEYAVRELAELVEVGMTPMQAIQAATLVNAELLGWENRIGTVEPGKLADLIAVEGNPLEDISALEQVRFVLVGGQVARQD
jgi:imidazolonepropionase-like amidohydrolase